MYNPQLDTFIRVAEAGSFNKAAEELFISTPAVIKQINQINVVDFDFFSLDVFNRCENSQSVLMTIDAWAGVHPLLKTLPVDWGYKMPYGVLHAPEPAPSAGRFLDAARLLCR